MIAVYRVVTEVTSDLRVAKTQISWLFPILPFLHSDGFVGGMVAMCDRVENLWMELTSWWR